MAETERAFAALQKLPDGAIKLLGFCRRSGKLICGVGQVMAAVTGKRPPAVAVIAADASERTQKQLSDKCSFYGVRLYRAGVSGDELAHVFGKAGTVMAVCAADDGISKQIIRMAESGEG